MSIDKNTQNDKELTKEFLDNQKETTAEQTTDHDGNEEANDKKAQSNDQQDLQKELEELKDSYLRLHAEYDNYRKRTMKEKSELIKYAGEKTIVAFLGVLDDFDLALKNIEQATSQEGITEGLELIQHKLISTLKSLGVNEMNVIGSDFNAEEHDAIAMVPSEDQKGKIIDCVQKGYTLNEKVVRHPKVVVGN